MILWKMRNKDLRIKVGTPEQAFWNEVVVSTKRDIENLEKTWKYQKAILEMAEEKLKKASKKGFFK